MRLQNSIIIIANKLLCSEFKERGNQKEEKKRKKRGGKKEEKIDHVTGAVCQRELGQL